VVLREVARRVADELRTVDRAMRYGGEEIALILVQTDRTGALDLARRVVRTVERDPILVSETIALNVTVSAGAAAMPQDADSGLRLLNAADKALYAAKARGRNRAVGYNEVTA
jgi:diguanylate cyclase (GGDEF)-like protein